MMDCQLIGVSVVMPAYNAEKTIELAILSVIKQSYSSLELIVVDDCSRDDTAKIVQKCAAYDDRIKYLRNETNQGVAVSRNSGVAAARYPWVAFLDSDDVWEKDKLEQQLAVIGEHPEAAICFTGSAFMDETGKQGEYTLHVPEKITFQELLKQNLISCSSVLVKTDVIGRFPMCQEHNMHEDYVTWLGVLRQTPYAVGVDKPLLIYRVSSNSKSGNKIKAAGMQWRSYRFIGLSVWKSIFYFCHYVIRNLKKYRGIHRGADVPDGGTVSTRVQRRL